MLQQGVELKCYAENTLWIEGTGGCQIEEVFHQGVVLK